MVWSTELGQRSKGERSDRWSEDLKYEGFLSKSDKIEEKIFLSKDDKCPPFFKV